MPQDPHDSGTISITNFGVFLFSRAEHFAWPLRFSTDCERDLKRLIDAGVRRMEVEGFSEDYEKFREAEGNLEKLVAEMREQALQAGVDVVPESSLRETLRKLCPVFPFC